MNIEVSGFFSREYPAEKRMEVLAEDHELKKIGIRNVMCRDIPPDIADDSFDVDDNVSDGEIRLALDYSCITGDIIVREKNWKFHLYSRC